MTKQLPPEVRQVAIDAYDAVKLRHPGFLRHDDLDVWLRCAEWMYEYATRDDEQAGLIKFNRHQMHAEERCKVCVFCKWDLPLSRTEPVHSWYDADTDRICETPCYYDQSNSALATSSGDKT